MNRKRTVSAYTPSNTDPSVLERIFVQRHKLLDQLVKGFERAMLSEDMVHVLLVGPRGCGKTHLVTLVQDRLQRRPRVGDKMRVAWLGEDAVITGLIDFALEVADQLTLSYPGEFATDFRSETRQLPVDEAAEAILRSIIQRLGNCKLLVVVENLDRAFTGLGEMGQRRWRALLQEEGRVATLATSPALFDEIASRDQAFFGFFDIRHLQPLSVEDARHLIANIAREQQDTAFLEYLDSFEGRYRIRALHHLAGGNHRMYVLLSEFLTKESLDDLVAAFENLADELTPYFQERLRWLAPQQARLVQSLCNADGALTVKQLSKETFIAERNCSKQLGSLKQKGYVRSTRQGKESYYEMAEPLMRLCLEVKNQRGRPLRLAVAFLRAWFPLAELEGVVLAADGSQSRTALYCESALGLNMGFEDTVIRKLDDELRVRLEQKDYAEAIGLAEEIAYADPLRALDRKAKTLLLEDEPDQAIDALSQLLSEHELSGYQKALVLRNRAIVYGRLGAVEKELADYTDIIEMPGATIEQKAKALLNRGVTYGRQGEVEKELADCLEIIKMPKAPIEQKAGALLVRGVAYRERGELERALPDFEEIIDMQEAPDEMKAHARQNRGATYGKQGDHDKALSDFTAIIDMPQATIEQKARALFNRGVVYWHLRDYDRSRADYTKVVNMEPSLPGQRTRALFALPESIIATGSLEETRLALIAAFKEGDGATEGYGGTPSDLLKMVLRQSHHRWSEYVTMMVPIYREYGAGDKLSTGLTRSIEELDQGGYSDNQLDLWNRLWQEAGAGFEALEVALRALDAAIRAIQSKSERPLFDLQLEIRELVRPLLSRSL